nr:MFS transporter [Kribbella shirazensis]
MGRPYWLLWTAGAISFAGDGIMFGALPLLAASITRDPRIVSLSEAAGNVGWLLLGLISGVMVDRWRRTSTMWIVDAIRAVVAGALAAAVLSGLGTIPLLLVTAFLLGMLAPFFDNAASVVVTDVVVPTALERANGYSQVSLLSLKNLIGPPLGAALFVLSHGLPVLLNAVSFAIAALLVWTIRTSAPARVRAPDRHLGRELREGLVYLWRHKLLRTLCLLLTIVNGVGAGILSILVLYVLEVLHLPEQGFGWLVAIYAVGGVAGAFVTPRLSRRMTTSTNLVAAMVISSVAIIAFGLLTVFVLVAIAAIVLGFGSTWWNVVSITLRQRMIPAELLGRVTAVYRMVAFCAAPLGAVGAGFLAHTTDLRTPYLLLGLLQLAATAVSAPMIRREVRASADPGSAG